MVNPLRLNRMDRVEDLLCFRGEHGVEQLLLLNMSLLVFSAEGVRLVNIKTALTFFPDLLDFKANPSERVVCNAI